MSGMVKASSVLQSRVPLASHMHHSHASTTGRREEELRVSSVMAERREQASQVSGAKTRTCIPKSRQLQVCTKRYHQQLSGGRKEVSRVSEAMTGPLYPKTGSCRHDSLFITKRKQKRGDHMMPCGICTQHQPELTSRSCFCCPPPVITLLQSCGREFWVNMIAS